MDIAAYVGGESEAPGAGRILRLASNESYLGPSPKAIAAYREQAQSLHRYPDGGSSRLREALAEVHGLDPDRIVCGSGSDELIGLLARCYAGPDDEVLYSAHGFLMYPIAARSVGAVPVAAPEADLTTDVDALLARVTDHTRVVFIANPNNPTGTYIPARALRRLHAALPDRVLLVIDAAYAEYVTRNDYEPGAALVAEAPNVVMTRTFSKIHGLAALRLGWAYCPAPVADVLNRVRGPFNVTAPAQEAGCAAALDIAFTEKARIETNATLDQFAARVAAMGLAAPTSVGNFLLARFPDEPGGGAAEAYDYLASKRILTRRMAGYGLPTALRIGIGAGPDMDTVADAIEAFLGGDR